MKILTPLCLFLMLNVSCTVKPLEEEQETATEQVESEQPEFVEDESLDVCDYSNKRGCLKGQISHSTSLWIDDREFHDADDLGFYLVEYLYREGYLDSLDSDQDGTYIKLRTPITNRNFAVGFSAAIKGSEIRDPFVFTGAGHFQANNLLPGNYVLRFYKKLSLVEHNEKVQIVREKCLRIEHLQDVEVRAGQELLIEPIENFTLKVFSGNVSCKSGAFSGEGLESLLEKEAGVNDQDEEDSFNEDLDQEDESLE